MFPSDFNPAPVLTGATLHLRPLRDGDFPALHAAAADPAIWAGHPARDRHKEEVFRPYVQNMLDQGGALVALDRGTGRIIGCSRYYSPEPQPGPGSIAIGFTFLNIAYWGGTTNFEMKRLMLDHAFASAPDVWFHIAPSNLRSQKATAKLGAVHVETAVLGFSGTPTEWMCFRLRRADWARMVAARISPA